MADDKFTIVLKRSPEYKIYPGNVIYGGPTPNGEAILMNVCVDHAAFPNYVQHAISPEGKIDMAKIDDQAVVGNVERELLCGISMTIVQAKRTVEWLSQMIDLIERQRNG